MCVCVWLGGRRAEARRLTDEIEEKREVRWVTEEVKEKKLRIGDIRRETEEI